MSQKLGSFFKKGPMAGKQRLFTMLEDSNSKIITADFDTFPMNDEDVVRLEKVIRENSRLKSISLVDCNLSSDHLELLALAVLSNKTLQKFQVELFYDCSEKLHNLMTAVDAHLLTNTDIVPQLDNSINEHALGAIYV
ncbi:hypothetical protein ACD661_14520 [Legionella lytica]|uniref:STAS domain-containing protein n=1 Tax=Legionella lytica TaxID=96232 RepID=A0ABW8DCS8_9GAMM